METHYLQTSENSHGANDKRAPCPDKFIPSKFEKYVAEAYSWKTNYWRNGIKRSVFQRFPTESNQVFGWTDEELTKEENKILGERRAKYLKKKGNSTRKEDG